MGRVKPDMPGRGPTPAINALLPAFVSLIIFPAILLAPSVKADGPALSTLSDSERAWLQANAGKVELWYNPDFPPLEFAAEGGGFVGMGADVIALIEKRLGLTFNKRVQKDWNRHLDGLEKGACAIAPTIVQTEDRERYAYFTTPYARVPVVIIGTSALGKGLSLDDLTGRRVAVVSGFASEGYARGQSEGRYDVVTVPRVEEGLRAVAFGQVDAYVENLAVASYYISENGITNLQVCGKTDYDFVFRVAVSRKYPELYGAIQKALDDVADAELEEVHDRWISLRPREGPSPESVRLMIMAGAFLALLALGLAIISAVLKRSLNEKVASLKSAQDEIALSEARFRSLFLHAPLPLIEFTLQGDVVKYNDAATRLLGYTAEELPTFDAWFEAVCPDPEYREKVRATWARDMEKAMAGNGRIEHSEYIVRCKDGSDRTFLIGAGIIGDRAVASLVDIDERKRMEVELEASRERFFTLFDMAPFSCVINDMEGRYIMVNRHFLESINLSRDQVVGRTVAELGRATLGDEMDHIAREIIRTGSSPLREVTVQDGTSRRSILFASRLIEWDDRRAILTATVDVSDKKEAEEELRRQKESLRVTLDSIGDAVIATDTSGRVTRMNPVAERLTGWTAAEAEGRPLQEVFAIVDARTRQPAEDPVSKVLSSGQIVSLSNHTILIARDGSDIQVADSGAPIRADDGSVIGVVLVFRDVTREYAVQEQLRQSQKMEAVGQLAGGVAHDFNNMLVAIIGGAELMRGFIQDDPDKLQYLDMILNAAGRASDLTRKLLTFSRKHPAETRPIDVNQPIREALALIERTIDPRVTLEVSLLEGPIEILGDQSQLQNAVLNLLINATHAVPGGGLISVTTALADLDMAACQATGFSIEPGRYVEIEVRDTGCGIPPENLHRIFEPFFSTKDPSQGTGLGLSTVFGAVERHGGAITVYSEPGNGTSVRVLLPTTERTMEEEAAEGEVLEGSGRLLVVDDEPTVRTVAVRILESLGYEVTSAENGREALEIFAANGGRFDLVILDMIMPEMNGRDCFKALRKMRPDLRVLLSSGFSREEDVADMRSEGLAGFIHKPFRAAELGKAVRRAILS